MGEASPTEVRRLAMDYLARREHGYQELIQKLAQRGVEPQLANEVISTLADEGLQDDARFAQAYARSQANRGRGPRYIENGLRQRGLDMADAERALRSLDKNWTELASDVAQKKYGLEFEDAAGRAAQLRFLMQRGFTSEQSVRALRSLNRRKD